MVVPSTAGLVQGNVGVKFFAATALHPPLRLFFPLNDENNKPPSSHYKWLQERGVAYALNGYARFLTRSRLLTPIVHLLSWILPVRWRRVPHVIDCNSKEKALPKTKLPVIVFSHGLTGTGQEHALLFAAWASLGFYVVSVHHTDGSSSRVRLANGTDLDYEHGPAFRNYDANFRPKQIEKRATEMLQACEFCQTLLGGDGTESFCIAGYSYGAATAARVLTMMDTDDSSEKKKPTFAAAMLLDGWFYIDVSESAGIEFRFPKQAFDDTKNKKLQHTPRLFVNSEQFANMPKLYDATRQLTGKNAEMHIIKDTGHQNFCDVIFWAPLWLLRLVLGTTLGSKDTVEAYREIVNLTSDFLIRQFKKKKTN